MANMGDDELKLLRARLRGMADRRSGDEDQRFQVLVGAIMSSRARATVVGFQLGRHACVVHVFFWVDILMVAGRYILRSIYTV